MQTRRAPRASRGSRHDFAFIARTCGADERLILGARMHWITLVIGALWLAAFAAAGIALAALIDHIVTIMVTPDTLHYGYMLARLATALKWIGIGIGCAFFLCYYIVYDTTRIGLTTRRLIMCTGLLFVKLHELDLEEVKSESVDHGMLGRMLDYGEIVLDARFVENFRLPTIADPYRLLRAMHEVRARVGDTVGNPATVQPAAPAAPVLAAAPPAAAASSAFIGEAAVPAQAEVLDETDDYVIYKQKKPQTV